MQAVVKTTRAPGAEVRTVRDPEPHDDEVLVAVRGASVCGTDVHIWKWNDWAQGRIAGLPLVLGHELAGEVVQVGRRVQSLAVGDRVSAETHIADGTCYQCKIGKMHICEHVRVLGVDRDGVFAEFAVLPEVNAWKNDPKLDLALASAQEPLGNAVHALLPEDNVEDLAGKNVLITGCGPIGLLAIAAAKTFGAETVVATEVNPVRSRLAQTMGADLVLDPRAGQAETVARVREATEGHGVDVGLEMSGYPGALPLLFESLTAGGRVSLLGLFDGPVSLDLDNAVIFKAARIHGIFGRRMFETWYTVRGLLAKPEFRERMAKIITHRLPIPDVAKAMELIDSGAAAKIALEARW